LLRSKNQHVDLLVKVLRLNHIEPSIKRNVGRAVELAVQPPTSVAPGVAPSPGYSGSSP
jgi:hypothetical protein